MIRTDSIDTCLSQHSKDITDLLFYDEGFKTLSGDIDIPLIQSQLDFIGKIKIIFDKYRNLKDVLNKYKERYELEKNFKENESTLKSEIDNLEDTKIDDSIDDYNNRFEVLENKFSDLIQKMENFKGYVNNKVDEMSDEIDSFNNIKSLTEHKINCIVSDEWRYYNDTSVYIDVNYEIDDSYKVLLSLNSETDDVIYITPNNVYPRTYGFRVYIDGLDLENSKKFKLQSIVGFKS